MKNFLSIFILVAVFAACASNKQMQNTIAYKELPLAYADQSSESISQISRNVFLNDTILTNLIDTAFIYNNDLQMAFQRIEMAKANLQYFKGKF